jgi:hypothetical protein
MLIIAETKLDETFPNSQFEVENDHLWRADRSSHGGGVSGCFFLVSLNSSKMSVFTSDVVSGVKGRLSTRGAFEEFPIDSFNSKSK